MTDLTDADIETIKNAHPLYPYGEQERFQVAVDLYETSSDLAFSGSLGDLIDENLKATLGDGLPSEFELWLSELRLLNRVFIGGGAAAELWLLPKDMSPAVGLFDDEDMPTPPEETVAAVRAKHPDYPYADRQEYDVEVQVYEGESRMAYVGSLGGYFDYKCEAALGDVPASHLEELASEFRMSGQALAKGGDGSYFRIVRSDADFRPAPALKKMSELENTAPTP